MALDLRARRNNFSIAERALRHRMKDYENETLSRKEEDVRLNNYLKKSDFLLEPSIAVNQPIPSSRWREFLRDTKFFIHLNNLELQELERDIKNLVRQSNNSIERLQKEADALDSITLEEEIRLYKGYDFVHFNAFVREKDMALPHAESKWLSDYKTDLSFETSQFLNIIPGAGATLPVMDRLHIPLENALLIGEETDVGDTVEKIISTNPRNVFLPGKIFRHVIIRREHDETTRKYNRNISYCTLLLEIPGIQLVNTLKLIPASGSSIIVNRLSYINEANEEVDLSTVQADSNTGLVFLFEPVRARQIKLRLAQHAPVTKLGFNHKDLEVTEINKVLEGLSWSSRLSSDEEYIEGRVFDFSIKDISIGLTQYGNTGVFRSKDIRVSDIASASVADQIELIQVNSQFNGSGRPASLIDSEASTEYYLGIDFSGRGKRLISDLIPMPDSYPVQVEYLPLVGAEAKVKFLPDFLWNLDALRVIEAVSIGVPQVQITTSAPHGFADGDQVVFIGPAEHPLLGVHTVRSPTEYTFGVRQVGTAEAVALSENTAPWMYVYADDSAYNDITNPPIRVYEDGVALDVGSDYQINFGVDSVWAETFPRGDDLTEILEDPRSGKMQVKILRPSYDSTYWIEYRPYSNQYLGKTKLIQLKNGRVVFDKKFRDSHGAINVIAILRGDYGNPYITPVINSYSLRIRSYK